MMNNIDKKLNMADVLPLPWAMQLTLHCLCPGQGSQEVELIAQQEGV